MAFCAKCGAQLGEGFTFCGACGAPVGQVAAPVPTATASMGMSSNVAGLLAYVLGPITGTAFLLIDPYREQKFVRFHAFQSIFYCIAAGILFWALRLVLSILNFITFGLGAFAALGITSLFALLLFLIWLFLLFKAYRNERFMLPYIGTLAASAADLPPSASNVNAFLAYVLWFISGIIL